MDEDDCYHDIQHYRIVTPDAHDYGLFDSSNEAYKFLMKYHAFSSTPHDNHGLKIEEVATAETWRYSEFSVEGEEMARGEHPLQKRLRS